MLERLLLTDELSKYCHLFFFVVLVGDLTDTCLTALQNIQADSDFIFKTPVCSIYYYYAVYSMLRAFMLSHHNNFIIFYQRGSQKLTCSRISFLFFLGPPEIGLEP